jgi:magnesium transporter
MQASSTKGKLTSKLVTVNWTAFQSVDRTATITELRSRKVPESFIETALAAGALPRFEMEGDSAFFLLRTFDIAAEKRAAGAPELTRKIAVILMGQEVITVQRSELDDLPVIPASASMKAEEIVTLILERTLATYTDEIGRNEDLFATLEAGVFNAPGGKVFRLKEAYFLKRRLSIQRKMLVLTHDAVESAATHVRFKFLLKTPLIRRMTRAMGSIDTFLEGMNHLLQLQIALVSQKTGEASQRTNDVMRVLTVFSAFFLPLSFVAGVYGMNFQFMPELHHPYGYAGALGLMALMSLGIFIWFRKRGLIGKVPVVKPISEK